MATLSKDKIKAMVMKGMLDIHNHYMDVKKSINNNMESALQDLNTLLAQIPQSASGPLITKTPKILRKKGTQRIETIPENDVVTVDSMISDETFNVKAESLNNVEESSSEVTRVRAKRKASEKAADNIKKHVSLSLSTKMRRPLSFERESDPIKIKQVRRTKRKQHTNSSDEESQGPTKHSKTEEVVAEETVDNNNRTLTEEVMEKEEENKTPMNSNRTRTLSSSNKKSTNNIMDDTVVAPKFGGLDDRSMYEDAIERPMPIMNSTMNLNTTQVMNKMMNLTVVLEPLSIARMNETVTLNGYKISDTQKLNQTKTIESHPESKSTKSPKVRSQPEFKSLEPMKLQSPRRSNTRSPTTPKIGLPSAKPLQDRMQELKETMVNKEFDDLITEDESSPEIKKHRPQLKKREIRKRQKHVISSVTSSEDEILSTPAKPTLKEVNSGMTLQEIRNAYKSNALFSPYAKESVKKRVEAFEQAGGPSPKPGIDVNASTRVTRTKTRALVAAQTDGSDITKPVEKSVTQQLARKSLAKAKKISLVKQTKETEEYKENKVQSVKKMQRLLVANKGPHPSQQKTTPLRKAKIQLPMSVSRIPQTPSNYPITYKSSSATRTNIITSVDSFIQTSKPTNKRNSLDKQEEKKRKMNDEDARKKREETLRLQTEEKRRKRQEKELKNKLAREAKEKLEVEKRQKAEKEREEKARLAQQMQEKQREELEKKRMAQLQRAHEKEERRRLEEQQRLQRLQEQEEAERILAEQRRREQEAEKRKEFEARAQQQANAEALRMKNQMLQTQAKYANKHHQGPTNYILDSEPDEDESDNESKPKHEIPHWAQPSVRRGQLSIQRYVPTKSVIRFFDSKKCTPDLTVLFQGIDRSRLKRTSSAIWKTPPRYSMMMGDAE